MNLMLPSRVKFLKVLLRDNGSAGWPQWVRDAVAREEAACRWQEPISEISDESRHA